MIQFCFLLALIRSSLAMDAVCVFAGDGNGQVTGEVHLFNAHEDAETEIHGVVVGLTPGLHGFHIHAQGDLGDHCKAAGGHFNPGGAAHGAPGDQERHMGDLGNIDVDAMGQADIKIDDHVAKMSGENSILGKAIVIHEGMDDLGRGGDEGSITTGNAGPRAACCIITEISQPTPPYNL